MSRLSKEKVDQLAGLLGTGILITGEKEKLLEVRTSSTVDNFTFQQMMQLPAIFGTEHLDFSTETESGGYCETCSYEYSVLVITAKYD